LWYNARDAGYTEKQNRGGRGNAKDEGKGSTEGGKLRRFHGVGVRGANGLGAVPVFEVLNRRTRNRREKE